MGRGSTQDLIKNLINCLSEGSKSITEISDVTKLYRTAIAKYLTILKDSGLVMEEQKGNSKLFTLISNYKTDTYFGLPLDQKTEELIDSLYSNIKKKWEDATGRPLLKTTAQKIIYSVIKKCNLAIPTGWYIYGGICIKPYDPSLTYNFTNLDSNVNDCVENVVKEYSPNKHEYESKKQQYHEEVHRLYNTKEEIFSLLYSKKFSKNSIYILQKKYIEFIRLIPEGDEKYHNLIDDYYTIIIDITKNWDNFVNENDDVEFTKFKQKLTSSFEILWRLVAQFNFKSDLFKGKFYTQALLDGHFKLDLEQTKEELVEVGSELQSIIPSEELNNESYNNLKQSINSIKPLESKEQKIKDEELKKLKKEKGQKDTSEDLFKKFGL